MLVRASSGSGGGGSATFETITVAPNTTETVKMTNGMYVCWYSTGVNPNNCGKVENKVYSTFGRTSGNISVSYDTSTETLSFTSTHTVDFYCNVCYW